MSEIMFLFGGIFGVGCGLLLNKTDRMRQAWLEEKMLEYRDGMHMWRKRAEHYNREYLAQRQKHREIARYYMRLDVPENEPK